MKVTKIIFAIVLSAGILTAQNSARKSFDVASIKPSAGTPPAGVTAGVRIDGAHFQASLLTLKDYIAAAYRLKLYQVSGPDWIATDRFDVSATLPEGTVPGQSMEMMQSLLADRFEMKTHREKKEFPVYAIVVVKGGLKMTEAPPDAALENVDPKAAQEFTGAGSDRGVSVNLGRGSSFTFANNKFEAKRLDMAAIAGTLERFLDRPIVDATDLKGSYDFSVAVTPEDYQAMLIRSAVTAGVILPPQVLRLIEGAPTPSSLFDGLEKLGLRLEARKAPLDVLVVDSMRKTPTEN